MAADVPAEGNLEGGGCVAWALDVGHGHAMKRGGWPKRLGNVGAVLLHPYDLLAD
ncbi:hypothetical protein [Phytohabitans kaempferiae]|uniref:Uncharacterized protein n=1 Tax=Phytohabitans kaempferiae TaxID=1620943 RepID=A0ABV6LY88_9ACTN